jgi:hypothetical protein
MLDCLHSTLESTGLDGSGEYHVIDTIYAGRDKVILTDVESKGKYFREIDLN